MTNEEIIKRLESIASAELVCDGLKVGAITKEYFESIQETARLAISALSRDRWISVKKEMPAPQQVVLCRFKNGKCAVCFWGNYKWNDVNDFSEYIAVTHWRELPAEPPKEET